MHARRLPLRALTVAVAIATASVGRVSAGAQPRASPFAVCERPAGATWSYDDLLCVYREARQRNAVAEGQRRLRTLGAGRVEQPWATLVLAHLTIEPDELRAIELYGLAAEGFVRSREAEGEVVARQNLATIYRRRGQIDAAGGHVELALKAAAAAGAPLTMARAAVVEAGHQIDTGGDIGRAHRALLRAERLAFPGGSIGLRRSILFQLANTSLYLGRFDEAIDALERHRALRAEDGSTVDAAAVAFNLLNLRITMGEARPLPGTRERLLGIAQEVLAEAQTLKRPTVEAPTHRVIGDLLRGSDPDGAASHLQRCLEIEAPLGHPNVRAACLWSLSLHEASRNSARAEQLSREAIAALAANRGGPLLAYAWQARLRLVWHTLSEEGAVAGSLEALDAIERLRAGQNDATSRAALFSNWTRDYYWLAGRLLEATPPRLGQAFQVGERLRARVLLEHRARAGLPLTEDRSRAAVRNELATHIGTVQRRLLSALDADHRRALLEQLALYELEQNELTDTSTDAVAADLPPFASIDAVQRTLADGEAMLWFSIAPWQDLYDDFGGGAWVVGITRQRVGVHRLSVRADLDSQVAALVGLLSRRESNPQMWSTAARQLGETLLGTAVAELPSGIERLVIVSDGAIHRLPFEALRVDANPRTLGERFDLTLVPSATLWLHLRSSELPASAKRTLVFADPDGPRTSPDDERPLARLPWARREAHAIAKTLALDSRDVLEGDAATEHTLKNAALSEFAVLHFAAHARADEAFPDRSAVFLAAGAPDEDGWLQPREIGRFDLRGRLVVLSACESAHGRVLSGEGPLSLARAFFAAGASGVVATRWPLRDDDAAFMMERFYRALGSGATAGAALRRARRDAIDAGLPAAAWAGVALLGDGLRAPVQALPGADRFRVAIVALVVLLVMVVAAGGWHVGRRNINR